jgi:serine/threonine-protein kinase
MEIMSKHLQASPAPPSERSPFTIPKDLDQLVLACLAKRPEDRPQSAEELSRRLSAIDLEPWTDAQAKAWWLALGPQAADVLGAEGAHVWRTTSGADETRSQ